MHNTSRVDVFEPALKRMVPSDEPPIASEITRGRKKKKAEDEEQEHGEEKVNVTYQNLVQEVLDELLLEWSRRKQSVKVGSKKLRDKVASGPELSAEVCTSKGENEHILQRRDEDVAQADDLNVACELDQTIFH